MALLRARGQLSLLDLNDAIISGTAPANPTTGTLWIDSSVTPNVLKKWDGDSWEVQTLSLSDLDNAQYTNLQNNITAVNNMSDDSKLTQAERATVKDQITQMVGAVPTDTYSLPALATIDASTAGQLTNVRRSAVSAGILTTNTDYVALGTAYSTLVTYLNAMNPKPWNVSSTAVNTLNVTSWRGNWNTYYAALYKLMRVTDEKLQGNIDDIVVGGRNYLRNTYNMQETTFWRLNKGSYITAEMQIASDATYGNVIEMNVTVNSATGNNWCVLENSGLTLPNGKFVIGQDYSVSFLIKNAIPLSLYLNDADGTDLVGPGKSVPVNANWTRVEHTFTATATGEIPLFRLSTADTTSTGIVQITMVMLEDGNKPSGWMPAPEDLTNEIIDIKVRVQNAEQKISADAIVSTVTTHTSFKRVLDDKADASTLSNYATTGDLEAVEGSIDGKIDDKIEALTLEATYATKGELAQTSTDITAKFSATGGMNLLKNSIGYADFIPSSSGGVIGGWNVTAQTTRVSRISNQDLDVLGFGSGFQIAPSATATADTSIVQDVPVIKGKPYTLSWYAKKDNNSTADGTLFIQIQEKNTSGSWVNTWSYSYNSNRTTNGYEAGVSDGFVAKDNMIRVRIYADGFVNACVTGLMLTIGDVALQWSLATGEAYNTNVKMDLNGIRVSRLDANRKEIGFTRITPDEFAGYYDKDGDGNPDKVFYLQEDETVSKKFKAEEEITMGTIKIIKINSGGKNGWAFVPTSG